jgi:nicotinamide mononucleotide (NMN) deamidase PncC
MSVKSKPRSKAAKKITPVTAAIVAAFITAVGGIAASFIQGTSSGTNDMASSSQSRSVPPTTRKSHPSPYLTKPLDPMSKTMPETEEYGAISFSNYAGPSGVQERIPAGQVVQVYCRIPGDALTPTSVGSAGWYKIRNPGGVTGYTAANCFYNDPGNGYGMEPNNDAFDPAVPIC